MNDVVAVALISGAFTFFGSVVTILFVTRKTANAEEKRGQADALATVQQVLANVGGVYDTLVKNVRESVEAEIQLEYQSKIEALEKKVADLVDAQEKWLEERREWEMGIALLIAQIGKLNLKPEWKPKAYQTGPLHKPTEAHGFQSSS